MVAGQGPIWERVVATDLAVRELAVEDIAEEGTGVVDLVTLGQAGMCVGHNRCRLVPPAH